MCFLPKLKQALTKQWYKADLKYFLFTFWSWLHKPHYYKSYYFIVSIESLPSPSPPRYVYPWAKRVMMSHDSYHCTKYPNSVPFPTRRENDREDKRLNFVGAVVMGKNAKYRDRIQKLPACPKKCRRNPAWTYCWHEGLWGSNFSHGPTAGNWDLTSEV